jgi:hypothetical protein
MGGHYREDNTCGCNVRLSLYRENLTTGKKWSVCPFWERWCRWDLRYFWGAAFHAFREPEVAPGTGLYWLFPQMGSGLPILSYFSDNQG